RANADLPDQAKLAYAFGARGIGLCRTEHMFFGEGRIPIVQRMILAHTEADRRKALDELLPLQRDDFYGVFKEMRGSPVTTRTIIEAACRLQKEGFKVIPEIMIPLVGHVRELRDQKAIVDRVARETMKAQGVTIEYLVGTMIEVPRGAVTADEVAKEAQFFS